MHQGLRKFPAGSRRHDRTESVETPWRLVHWLRARHPDGDREENVWKDEEQTTEGIVGWMPWLWKVPELR